MKQNDIVKILARDFGTSNVVELNKLLKAKDAPATKYKIMGKKLGHLGYTAVIKNIAEAGIKIFNVNKVSLIKYSDIEQFEKAKPKVDRNYPPRPKQIDATTTKTVAKAKKPPLELDGFEVPLDVYGNPLKEEKFRPKKPSGKAGSSFIPATSNKKKKPLSP